MATINVQAGVAAHVLPTRPEAAAESLQAIKTAHVLPAGIVQVPAHDAPPIIGSAVR